MDFCPVFDSSSFFFCVLKPGSHKILQLSFDFQRLRLQTRIHNFIDLTSLSLQCGVYSHTATTTQHNTNRFHSPTFKRQTGNLVRPLELKHEFRVNKRGRLICYTSHSTDCELIGPRRTQRWGLKSHLGLEL